MKTLIYSIFALTIISFYACSNSSGGGTVAPEEELYPELAGKWRQHYIGSDPRNIEYWRISTTSNTLSIGVYGLGDTVYRYEVFTGSWEGKTFRGVYRMPHNPPYNDPEFMQVTFVGSTMNGFTVDSLYSLKHVEFDGYKL